MPEAPPVPGPLPDPEGPSSTEGGWNKVATLRVGAVVIVAAVVVAAWMLTRSPAPTYRTTRRRVNTLGRAVAQHAEALSRSLGAPTKERAA